mgnify:CR=1 FL=1
MNHYEMNDDAIKLKLNINFYDNNEMYKSYSCIETWISNESNKEYHNILLFTEEDDTCDIGNSIFAAPRQHNS